MALEQLANIAEVFGMLVVAITLIFLTIQMRQNAAQSRLDSTHQVITRMNQAFDPIYVPENTRIWSLGLTEPDSLSADEKRIFELLIMRIVASFDTATSAYQHGLVHTELYDGLVTALSSFIATPGGSAWYATAREFFAPETRARLDGAAAPTSVTAVA